MHRKKRSMLFNKRLIIVGVLMLIQLVFVVLCISMLSDYTVYLYGFLTAVSVLVVVYIVNRPVNPTYKLAWVIPILLFPLFGGLLYILYLLQMPNSRFKRGLSEVYGATESYLTQKPGVLKELCEKDAGCYRRGKYLWRRAGFPVYRGTALTYLSPGEVKFSRLKQELLSAKHFIFLEYFIIEEGVMWDEILKILVDKAKNGVDVRLIYDDVGCLNTLSGDYYAILRKMGIQCVAFNPFVPLLSTLQNNRDHRKIAVIDGHTAFTGGINLADEYINAYERFGHWKDASVLIKGEAVWSFTVMFLQMWDFVTGTREDYSHYRPHCYHPEPFEDDGFVQPYGDSPMDDEFVGENVYLSMISRATRYVYINTPYLIVDNELMTALTLAGKSGVDVKIVTPHHPDKKTVHMVTRSYYEELLKAGIEIYEYTPGFIHSKTVVADDEIASVGTANFDYRSLYLHFECGVWAYQSRLVGDVKNDFITTLALCHKMTLEECRRRKWSERFFSKILRMFAPLM